jgi:hypothetical protein
MGRTSANEQERWRFAGCELPGAMGFDRWLTEVKYVGNRTSRRCR